MDERIGSMTNKKLKLFLNEGKHHKRIVRMLLISKTELTFEEKKLLLYLLYERIFLTNV